MDRKAYARQYGADPADVDAVKKFAVEHGLSVEQTHLGARLVRLSGTAQAVGKAFGVTLKEVCHAHMMHRSFSGSPSLPSELAEVVKNIVGLDNRPVAGALAKEFTLTPANCERLVNGHQASLKEDAVLLGELAQSVASLNSKLYLGLINSYGASRAAAAAPDSEGDSDPVAAIEPWQQGRNVSEEYNRYLTDLGDAYQKSYRDRMAKMLESYNVFLPNHVAELYNFPKDADGTGQTIGIIEFGGGFNLQTIKAYFDFIDVPMPRIKTVSIAGAKNNPGYNRTFDTEVYLDIEVAGAAAPGATIVVYFAPLTEQGFVEVFSQAIHDEDNRPDIISVSWGMAEWYFQRQPGFAHLINEICEEAASLGVTVCVPSGDRGSRGSFLGWMPKNPVYVDFPGSCPAVLSCGGTRLHASFGQISSEVVWNDLDFGLGGAGGGISMLFDVPDYQEGIEAPPSANEWVKSKTGRGTPDVASVADPTTGYYLLIDYGFTVTAGTSASAPLWSALLARINQRLGRNVGYLNRFLYERGHKALREITVGNNGHYSATPGWDACAGFGSPDGEALLKLLSLNLQASD